MTNETIAAPEQTSKPADGESELNAGLGVMEEAKKCENCWHECWRESCDVGVGIIYGPWGCSCGWSEDERYNILNGEKVTEHGGIIDQWGGVTPNV